MGKSYKVTARANGPSSGSAIEVVTLSVSAVDVNQALIAGQSRLEQAYPPAGGQTVDFNEVYTLSRVPAKGGDPDIVLGNVSEVNLIIDTSDSSITTYGATVSPWSDSHIEVPEGTPITFVCTDMGTATNVYLKDINDNVLADFTAKGDFRLIPAARDSSTVYNFTVKVSAA
jgi:hypothetical protein